jgi:hypothetical protein
MKWTIGTYAGPNNLHWNVCVEDDLNGHVISVTLESPYGSMLFVPAMPQTFDMFKVKP